MKRKTGPVLSLGRRGNRDFFFIHGAARGVKIGGFVHRWSKTSGKDRRFLVNAKLSGQE
jgi:hypothetical protein